NQGGAIAAIVSGQTDLVIPTNSPTDAAVIIGQAAARGLKGKFIGTSPTWNPGLLKSPAAAAIKALYYQSGPWMPFGADTPGHKAMREAIGKVDQPNDGYTSRWGCSYPMKPPRTKAAQKKYLTSTGRRSAVKS